MNADTRSLPQLLLIEDEVERIASERIARARKLDEVRQRKEAQRRIEAADFHIERAEAHRIKALPGLADRLALAVFAYAEQAEGRVMVRAQLAEALLGILMTSGLHRDPRRVDRPPD